MTLQTIDVTQMAKDYKWIEPEACNPLSSDLPLTKEQVNRWREHGYAVVCGLFPEDLINNVQQAFVKIFPPASSPEDAQERANKMDFGSGGIFDFPARRQPHLNAVAIHPRFINAVMQLFGVENENAIRLTQAEPWTKYGCANIRDAHHNQVVAAIVYYSDVDECLGSTAVVPRQGPDDEMYNFDYITYNGGHGGLQFYNNRASMEAYLEKEHPEKATFRAKLYEREAKVRFRKGTVLFYRILPGRAECEWCTSWHRGWATKSYATPNLDFEPWFASLTPAQRTVLGYPHPGHSYWTEATLRYNKRRWAPWGMDFTEYEEKLPPSK